MPAAVRSFLRDPQNNKTGQRVASGDLHLVYPASMLESDGSDPAGTQPDAILHAIYSAIVAVEQSSLNTAAHHPLIILDEANALEWIGCSGLALTQFFRATQAFARKV